MNETLKAAGHIGAELAAAKADLQREMERHRKTWRQLEQVTGLLREACELIQEQDARIEVDMLPAGRVLMSRIRAALSQQAEPQSSCKWTRDEDTGAYGTACGATWHLIDGGEPEEHGQYYCHHCGKQIDDEGADHE
ncbi:MAG: hypothetical protein CML01_11335 [Pseudomonas sp.]|nr:hypothetical protein [Pseudomonas sp.]|tara:strand:- start:18204 stop:18614 length:411 start_codon:yes stop_codon:yes gene_type:complete